MNEFVLRARLQKIAKDLLEVAKEMEGSSSESTASVKSVRREFGEEAEKVVETLAIFGIDATVLRVENGPRVSRVVFKVPRDVRYDSVTSLRDNFTSIFQGCVRVEAPVYGEDALAVEVPNVNPMDVPLAGLLKNPTADLCALPLYIGKKCDGSDLIVDLATLAHLIIGGAAGQGKTAFLNAIICGLIAKCSPNKLRVVLGDPRMIEFVQYAELPHLVRPILTDSLEFIDSLNWADDEMERRFKIFAREKCRNIEEYNKHSKEKLPYVVIIVDELADWMAQASKEIVPRVVRHSAMSRAVGIHLILSTQRPDANVYPEAIKTNVPGRIAFKTVNSVDSRLVLGVAGAEDLLGRGDLLFRAKNGEVVRAQGAIIQDSDIATLVKENLIEVDASDVIELPEFIRNDIGLKDRVVLKGLSAEVC